MNLSNPAAGAYTVVVQGWGVAGFSPFKLHTWLLGSADAGILLVDGVAPVTVDDERVARKLGDELVRDLFALLDERDHLDDPRAGTFGKRDLKHITGTKRASGAAPSAATGGSWL